MIARSASALLLSLVLSSPAAAQVRAVPVEAGTAPLAVLPGGTGSSSLSPSLSAPAFTATLGASPAASASFAASAAAPFAAASVASPSLSASAASSVAAAPAAAARTDPPSVPASPAAAPSRDEALPISRAASAAPVFGRGGANAAGEELPAPAALAAPGSLDALFDGGAARPPLAAAADGPELAPLSSAAPKPLAPSRLRRVLLAAAVGVPAVALVAASGALAPHASLLALHWIGQTAYCLANPFAFLFTIPQVHKMLSRRSADISTGMIAIGVAATATATLNFAFDGQGLMMYRNMAQLLGFAAMLFLKWRYARSPGQAPPSKRRALVEAGIVALASVGVMLACGPFLMAAIPGIALMSSLLVPIQVLSGFGFTYLMYVQLSKMARANSAGDSSSAMMWAYLGTKTIWVWSLATMLSLATGPAWLVLSAAAAFSAVGWLAGSAALSRLLSAPWSFLPEKASFLGRTLTRERMADIAAFVALSALILALSAAGYFAFVGTLGVPAAATSRFAMYLLYMVQSLVASLATLKTLRLQKSLVQRTRPSTTVE